MDEKDLKASLQAAVEAGGEIGNSTSYFSGTGIPTAGDDAILASIPEETLKFLPGSNGKLTVQYKTKSGSWISKGVLTGRHYTSVANDTAKVTDMLCRTTGLDRVKTQVLPVVATCKGEDGKVFSKTVNVLVFTEDAPFHYTDLGQVFLPIQGTPERPAWDAKNKIMHVTRPSSEHYGGLVLGSSEPKA